MSGSGGKDLGNLLGAMAPQLSDETYVFVTFPSGDATREQVLRDVTPLMQFQEREGETVILTQAQAQRFGLPAVFACRMIILNVHSSLEAVGFLAAVTTRLASLSIGVNPVSAFYHDHLFVAVQDADRAMAALRALSQENAR